MPTLAHALAAGAGQTQGRGGDGEETRHARVLCFGIAQGPQNANLSLSKPAGFSLPSGTSEGAAQVAPAAVAAALFPAAARESLALRAVSADGAVAKLTGWDKSRRGFKQRGGGAIQYPVA